MWGSAADADDIEAFLKISAAAFLLGYLRFAQRRYNPAFLNDTAAVKLFRSQFRSAMLEDNPLEECEITGILPEKSVWDIIGSGIGYGGEFPPSSEWFAWVDSRFVRCFGEFPSFCRQLNPALSNIAAGRHILAE